MVHRISSCIPSTHRNWRNGVTTPVSPPTLSLEYIRYGSTQNEYMTTKKQKAEVINEMIKLAGDDIEKGSISDGYHTFNELYEFRKLYNAALFNQWADMGIYDVHKSWNHSDGELCFGGGWFIVMATLPTGQISNHYEEKDWELFRCEARLNANEWDGHTAQDVAVRIKDYILTQKSGGEKKV